MTKIITTEQRATLIAGLIEQFQQAFPKGWIEFQDDGRDGWVHIAFQLERTEDGAFLEAGWPDNEWLCPNSLSGTVFLRQSKTLAINNNTVIRFDGDDGGFWTGDLEEWICEFATSAE